MAMVIFLLYFQCFNLQVGGLIQVLIFMCADISLFSSYQGLQGSSVLMGNGSHTSIRGVGTVDLKFTSRKIVQLKNMQHVLTIRKNLVSVSLLLRDGFKIVLESNKVVMSKHG
jgi:hypothetical protein